MELKRAYFEGGEEGRKFFGKASPTIILWESADYFDVRIEVAIGCAPIPASVSWGFDNKSRDKADEFYRGLIEALWKVFGGKKYEVEQAK